MKKHLLKLSVFLIVGGILYFTNIQTTFSHTAGGTSISGCSGSTYDEANNTGDCVGCHSSNKGYVSWITSNIPASGYYPGATYTITCKGTCTTSGHNSSFGFECTPQNQSTGKVVGTLANITTSGTGATTIASSTWITHTSSSYTGTDSNKWSFKWTAPTPGVGAVRFFATFNCGSGTSSSTGWIYFDSTHFKQASTVGIAQVTDANTNEISVYPNPIKDAFNVSYSLSEYKQVDINVYTIDGKQVGTLSSTEQTAGDHNQSLRMPSVAPGIYLIQVVQGEQVSYKKVVVEQ
jgi:hypothetical protein